MTAVTQTAQQRFTLPRIFWTDHFERCAEHPGVRVVVKETANYVTVDLDAVALADLTSDAKHYADEGVDGPHTRRLCRSARMVLWALGNP
jgi:threonine aldolase